MTDPIKCFRAYYSTTVDPYGQSPEVLQNTYAPEVAITPTLFNITVSTTYPLAFLISAAGGRVYPIVCPFDQSVLPGQGTARKYGLIGDVSDQGNLPSLMEVINDHLPLTGIQAVPSVGDMTGRWGATPADKHYLPPEVNGVNGGELARNRFMVPIPHQYVAPILQGYDEGRLTWRWIWEHIGEPITQDPNQLQAYAHFINYIRISSTRRPGATALDADHLPGSVVDISAALTLANVTDQALDLCRKYLPGLRTLDNVSNQLVHLANQGLQTQQLIHDVKSSPAPTLADKAPHLLRVIELLTESTNPATWPAYWTLQKSGA